MASWDDRSVLQILVRLRLDAMAKVIVGIHGLGNKPPKSVIADWWQRAMAEGLAAIGRKPDLPRFEMIYWADIIHGKPLDPGVSDPEEPLFVDEPYLPAPLLLRHTTSPLRARLHANLGRMLRRLWLNADLSLRYPRITERILSRYFEDLDAYYRESGSEPGGIDARVKGRILERAQAVLGACARDEVFLVCHSMGAIIGYDILSFHLPHLQVHTLATVGSPLGMPNVISTIADQMRGRGDREVVLRTPPGVRVCWVNFSDSRDLITMNSVLSETFAANDFAVSPVDKVVFNNYCVGNRRNPHKSFGYLRTPEFAAVLAAFLESRRTLGQRLLAAVRSASTTVAGVFRPSHTRSSRSQCR